jgi:hypothetical protein
MCGCIFFLDAAFFPRLGILFLWLFTPLITRAFESFIFPIIGLVLLPYSTLIYIIVYNPVIDGVYSGIGYGLVLDSFWTLCITLVELSVVTDALDGRYLH